MSSSYKPKLLLESFMKLGDTLLMTCAVRDLKRAQPEWEIAVETNFDAVWDNNPHLSVLPQGPNLTVRIGTGKACTESSASGEHISRAFHKPLEELLDIKIPRGPMRPEIFEAAGEFGTFHGEPYWLITTGGREDMETKIWPLERWQSVVDSLPYITFVQIGAAQDENPRLSGLNVQDKVGKTENIRDLFRLFAHCEGSLGAVSAQMHIAAAFGKPCVVVAGAREPASFEAYNTHRYIHNIGALPCARNSACWACRMGGCRAKRTKNGMDPEGPPLCMQIIDPGLVVKAIMSYYRGGVLKEPSPHVPVLVPESVPTPKRKYLLGTSGEPATIKIVANASGWNGGERSSAWIAQAFAEKGYRTEFIPIGKMNGLFQKNLLAQGHDIAITKNVTGPCDILCFYANDAVFSFGKPAYEAFNRIQAKRKVMVLNFRIGSAGKVPWSQEWDAYGFLCSELRDKFVKAGRGGMGRTFVLPPPAVLDEYFSIEPNYDAPLHLLRHSSQGDRKHRKDTELLIERVREIWPKAEFSFMPAPSWLPDIPGVHKIPENGMSVRDFLSRGNLYWYLLPPLYADNGPRAIMEAMAAGLPVIADYTFGARDRLKWLGNGACPGYLLVPGAWDDDFIKTLKSLCTQSMRNVGLAARAQAMTWNPLDWVAEIEGD